MSIFFFFNELALKVWGRGLVGMVCGLHGEFVIKKNFFIFFIKTLYNIIKQHNVFYFLYAKMKDF